MSFYELTYENCSILSWSQDVFQLKPKTVLSMKWRERFEKLLQTLPSHLYMRFHSVRRLLIENHLADWQLANRLLTKRHLANRHLANRHLANRHLANRHLANRHFAGTIDWPTGILLHFMCVDQMSVGEMSFDQKDVEPFHLWSGRNDVQGALV